MSAAEQAIQLVVRALNIWLAATGNPARISASDVTITQRNGVWFMAFQEKPR